MNKKIIIVSGGFDPVHVGHIRMIQEAAEYGQSNSVSDAGVAAEMANAGAQGAALNVKINLQTINDKIFCKQMLKNTNLILSNIDKSIKDLSTSDLATFKSTIKATALKKVPKATKIPPSYGVGSTFAGVADDFLKTKTAKNIGK